MTENRETLHPGRILLSQAMEPLGISRNQLARDIDVPVGRISDITNGKRGITADTALRLGRYFGTGPELWLRLQAEFDLYVARRTTWPAIESRVRVLDTHAPLETEASAEASPEAPAVAPDEAPFQIPADPPSGTPADSQVEPPAPEHPAESLALEPSVPEPPRMDQDVGEENEPVARDDPQFRTDVGGAEPDPVPPPETEEPQNSAQLYDRPEIFRDPEKLRLEPQDYGRGAEDAQPGTENPVTDHHGVEPAGDPQSGLEVDEELGIPPIPDRSKLYQSG